MTEDKLVKEILLEKHKYIKELASILVNESKGNMIKLKLLIRAIGNFILPNRTDFL